MKTQQGTYINELEYKKERPIQWSTKEEGYRALLKVVEYYDQKGYVNDKERLLNEVIYKIEEYEYINCGIRDNDGWKCNAHKVIINKLYEFEYKTGTGIDCQAQDSKGFAREKIVFDCILVFIDDANIISNMDMDEFIEEMGYDSCLEMVRKGERGYRDIKENTKKLCKFISYKTIADIREIIEL